MTDPLKPKHRCPGCGGLTAPNRHEFCAPCAKQRPDDVGHAGDVGFEVGDFS